MRIELIAAIFAAIGFGWCYYRLFKGAGLVIGVVLELVVGLGVLSLPVAGVYVSAAFGFLAFVLEFRHQRRKKAFLSGRMTFEGGGIRRGMSPVQVGWLFERRDTDLGSSETLQNLLNAGLDHTMIVLQPDDQKNWQSLANFSYWAETMDEDLFVAVHLTITDQNQSEFGELINKLSDAGISALSLSASNPDLAPTLAKAQETAYDLDLELIWDIPVPYSGINPISLELAMDGDENPERTEGAAKGWLYVEPDGDVLPAQGINEVFGNLLTDEWQTIWAAAKAWHK